MTDPKMDFRYRHVQDSDYELEAFKVTKGARWASHDWPPWLQTQGSANEINKVYTDPADPNRLFINLEAGRFGIEDDAYVVMDGGQISVQAGDTFEGSFTKIVPIPPRVLDEESLAGFERTHKVEDGKLVELSPIEMLDAALPPPEEDNNDNARPLEGIDHMLNPAVIGSQSNLRPKVEIALETMLEGKNADGILILKQALSDETEWCNCSPGQCEKGPRWCCREESPLVKDNNP